MQCCKVSCLVHFLPFKHLIIRKKILLESSRDCKLIHENREGFPPQMICNTLIRYIQPASSWPQTHYCESWFEYLLYVLWISYVLKVVDTQIWIPNSIWNYIHKKLSNINITIVTVLFVWIPQLIVTIICKAIVNKLLMYYR